MINKDTVVCISISKNAGNFGCNMHNKLFEEHNLNYIYKSFSVDNLEGALTGMRSFKIRGAGISMPYKQEVLSYVDRVSSEVAKIGATNTIVNDNNVLTAYNTDAYSSYTLIKKIKEETNFRDLVILGRGGYSKAVKYSGEKLKMKISQITRENWEDIRLQKDKIIFNCTPVKNLQDIIDSSSRFIDCNTDTETGSALARLQGEKQFELYTGIILP